MDRAKVRIDARGITRACYGLALLGHFTRTMRRWAFSAPCLCLGLCTHTTDASAHADAKRAPEHLTSPARATLRGHSSFARHALIFDNMLALRTTPWGAVNRFALGYRRQFIDKSAPLFADTYFAAKATTSITPTFALAGARVEFAPLAIVRLAFTQQFVGYFGNLGNLQSFADPRAETSPQALRENRKAGRSYASWGYVTQIEWILQARLKQWIARNEVTSQFSLLQVRAGDRMFFDRLLDLATPNHGWSHTNNFDVFFERRPGQMFGLRSTTIASHFAAQHQVPGTGNKPFNAWIERVGPAWLQKLPLRTKRASTVTSVFALVQWHLIHPYRTGQSVSAAIPTISAGVIVSGELWRSKP
jgi:hypothetical protein